MDQSDIVLLAEGLASNRRKGIVSRLPLDRVTTIEEAEDVQAEAIEAFGDTIVGYSLLATVPFVQHQLHSAQPIVGPLLASSLQASGSSFRLPHGTIGITPGLAFVIGRLFPEPGETVEPDTAATAVVTLAPALTVAGRRVSGGLPLDAVAGTADFGLNVACFRGAAVAATDVAKQSSIPVDISINGVSLRAGEIGGTAADRYAPITFLAQWARLHERQLEPGQIVVADSPVGIVQIVPGQTIDAEFGELGRVQAHLT